MLKKCDRIIVLKEGKIIEEGTHKNTYGKEKDIITNYINHKKNDIVNQYSIMEV